MGIFDILKKQFVDVIDWTESSDGVLAFRYPMADREIQNGGKLTVRDSQVALFVNEGEIADVFEPGLHTLSTQTLPILTSLKNWDKLFNSPFKSDVIFFSTRDQLDQRWGTQSPITVRDKEFGPIRIRAHGTYTFKINNPKTFYKKVSGTREAYTTEELSGQLRSMVLTQIGAFLGNGSVAFLDMAANQMEFSKTLQGVLTAAFAEYGLGLQSFFVQSVSLPEELQAAMDKGASARLVGDIQKYAQFQAAEAIGDAAKNPGGMAGLGASVGAGAAIGQAMSGALGSLNMGGSGQSGAQSSQDVMGTINQLHELMKKGILTQAEFDAKKAELLKKL